MGNTWGHSFRVTSFGESHSRALGVVIDGCPPRLSLCEEDIQKFLDERRPGQSDLVTARKETDRVIILSGVENGRTLGTPIGLMIENEDAKPEEYSEIQKFFRPSHGDYTNFAKYGVRSASGGGRSSVRETVARVAAGAVARKILEKFVPDLHLVAYVESVKDVKLENFDPSFLRRENVYKSLVRCPSEETAEKMMELIRRVKLEGDSVGGVVRGLILNCPIGLGEPVFDKLDADLAKAMMSLQAVKGFELGSGFQSTQMFGSEHNDPFVMKASKVGTLSNRSGGIQGGISNGEAIDFRVAFKPTSTIFKPQQTVTEDGEEILFEMKRTRHDPCVLPRAVPIVEAMAYITLADHFLRHQRCLLEGKNFYEKQSSSSELNF